VKVPFPFPEELMKEARESRKSSREDDSWITHFSPLCTEGGWNAHRRSLPSPPLDYLGILKTMRFHQNRCIEGRSRGQSRSFFFFFLPPPPVPADRKGKKRDGCYD